MSYDLIDYDPDVDFDRWYTDTTAGWVDRALPRTGQILEVGCATGRMTARLVREGRRIVAVTLSSKMLMRGIARELPGVVWMCDDVSEWEPVPGKAYDAVVCTLVLHELPDPGAMLATLRRLVRPGGLLVMTVPAPDSLHRLLGGPYSERSERFGVQHLRSIDWWLGLLEAAGWAVMATGRRMLKPYPNQVMETVPEPVLNALARYDGPHGTLYYFEAVAA